MTVLVDLVKKKDVSFAHQGSMSHSTRSVGTAIRIAQRVKNLTTVQTIFTHTEAFASDAQLDAPVVWMLQPAQAAIQEGI